MGACGLRDIYSTIINSVRWSLDVNTAPAIDASRLKVGAKGLVVSRIETETTLLSELYPKRIRRRPRKAWKGVAPGLVACPTCRMPYTAPRSFAG
jgi:hypothetical protein